MYSSDVTSDFISSDGFFMMFKQFKTLVASRVLVSCAAFVYTATLTTLQTKIKTASRWLHLY